MGVAAASDTFNVFNAGRFLLKVAILKFPIRSLVRQNLLQKSTISCIASLDPP